MSFIGDLNTFYIPSLSISDVIEIVILIFSIYKVIIGLRNTRAMVILKGILILFIFYNLAYLFDFQAILVLFQSLITLLVFAIIVIFQPEMRRFLEQIGTKNLTGKLDLKSLFTKKEKTVFKYYSDKVISELGKACFAMGEVKTGALIVIERDIPLTEYIDTGIMVNADLTSQLLINIFEKNTPLHDGAVIQQKDKIVAATCYLPLTENMRIDKHMGTRHRAAIGISEVTDCIVIVVSEETGSVSVAIDGKIQYNLTKEDLTSLLYQYQGRKEISEVKKVKNKLAPSHFFRKEDLSTRIISILVGLVAWVLLINISDPIKTVVIEDVPIEFINVSVIESTGKTFELLSEDTVHVKVTDRRSIVDNLRAKDISVIADCSKLSYVNAIPLYGVAEQYPSVVVEFVEIGTVNISLDSIISREVDITLEKEISEDSKTFVPMLDCEQDTIIVTGGKSVVDTIDKVVFTYDVTDAEGTYSGLSIPKVYDRNGNILDNDLFTFNIEMLKATGISYPVKEIPIYVDIDSENVNGYTISSVEFEPKTIKVAGDSDYLSAINQLSVIMDVNLNVDSLSNNQFVKTLKISEHLPEGVYFADSKDELVVTLTFEEFRTKEISFGKEDISVVGLESDYKVDIKDDDLSITISGEDAILDKISKQNIIPFIDVSTLPEGEYNLILQFEGLDDVILVSNISVKLEIGKV